MQIGANGYLKAIYTHRSVSDSVQQFVDQSTGITHVVKNGIDFGNFANRLWANTDDGQRVTTPSSSRPASVPPALEPAGHYTLQLKNDGNQGGRSAEPAGRAVRLLRLLPRDLQRGPDLPHRPPRRLPAPPRTGLDDLRSRDRPRRDHQPRNALPLRLGHGLHSIRSHRPALNATQTQIGSAIYPDLLTSQTIFYSQGRGSEFFENAHLFDPAVTYTVPVAKRLRPWVKAEVRNMFNSTPLVSQHHDAAGSGQPPRCAGHPDGLHQGQRFRNGNRDDELPVPARVLHLDGHSLLDTP